MVEILFVLVVILFVLVVILVLIVAKSVVKFVIYDSVRF
jgi:hypothetical protein